MSLEQQVIDLTREFNRLKQEFDNRVKPEVPGPWVDWTPTVTQSGSVAVTVSLARYKVDNDGVEVRARLVVTGSGTGGNVIVIGGQPTAMLPSISSSFNVIGVGAVIDISTSWYGGCSLIAVSTTDWRFIIGDAGTAVGNYVGAQPNFALAANDVISFAAIYEKA